MRQNNFNQQGIIAMALSLLMVSGTFSIAEEKQPENATQISTAAVPAPEAAKPEEAQKTGNEELLNAISGLNYKIEYLQSSYNRISADIENLRIADRDQKKMFIDRLSAIPVPDTSKIDSLAAESSAMSLELSQIKADIAEIKLKLSSTQQVSENNIKKELDYVKDVVSRNKISGDGYYIQKCHEFFLQGYRV